MVAFNTTEIDVSSLSNLSNKTKYEILDELREWIKTWTRKESIISKVYRENQAVIIAEFGVFNYLNEEGNVVSVPSFAGSPERTVAKIRKKNTINLPVISILQTTTNSAESRAKYDPLLVYGTIWSETKQRAQRIISTVPKAVDIHYEITVWAKYKNDLDQLVEQIILKFNPSARIETKYTTESIAILDEESDESSILVSDREDRVLKKRFKIHVITYIPKPVFLLTSTGQIENFYLETEIDG